MSPFAGVISRDQGEPWGPTGMSTAKWMHVPTQTLPIAQLHATQPGVLFHALTGDRAPVGGDPLPHVIAWRGAYYLEDGHHRVMRAALAGHAEIEARVLQVPTQISDVVA